MTLVERAMVIAAAGGHNVLLVGPPGTGKTALAQWMARLLPPLTSAQASEVQGVYDAAHSGRVVPKDARPPFCAPHHTASTAALVGGGVRPRPGEVSLAHNGVLFLDELAEWRRTTLAAIAGALDNGQVILGNRPGTVDVRCPARPQVVVAAMNPCSCGWAGVDGGRTCTCSAADVQRYRARAAPLLPLFDIRVRLHAPYVTAPAVDSPEGEALAAQVRRAHALQLAHGAFNGRLAGPQLAADRYRWDDDGAWDDGATLYAQIEGISARAYERLLRVARTIADLEESHDLRAAHVAEALTLCPQEG